MFDRIAEALGRALGYAVLAGLAWYSLAPFFEAPAEFQKGLISGLVIAYVASLIFKA
ncbi:hypothetical protein [Hyphomicrobium sp. ghe19]|uniref:hypothetical protein n=1 Tax=Hyphomicrobium sp. ghe19 TaxID=2682968 RepID=UPI0013668D14|nr:hypothetical protein HYPP_01531 [Hyphomicrobium sp. ghe19]